MCGAIISFRMQERFVLLGIYKKNKKLKGGKESMKRILTFVLALTLVFGTMSFAVAAPADVVGTDYEDATTRLGALEIMVGFPDGTFKPDEPVTRAQFAKIIVTALGIGDAAAYAQGATQFADVPAGHWASGYINVAVDMSIINGYGDGNFGPDDQVTYAQAITMIVRALGYTPKAEALGGYPGGYLAVAAEKDITEDVNVVSSLAAKRGDVALMVDNSLQVPMMIQKTWGQYPEYTEDEDTTLLEDKLGVDEIEGRVTDIARTNDNLDDDEIILAGDTYTVVCDANLEYLFGLEVTAFADGDEIIGVEVDSDVFFDAIEVNADGDELTLVDADKDYDISEDVVVYEDGEEDAEDPDAVDDADYAKVVLNDDGDVIFVDAYVWDDVMVVEEVDEDIVYSYGEELEVEDYTVVKDGKTIDFSDIAAGDILFYNEDAEYAEVFVKTVKGEIDRIFTDAFRLENDEDYDIDGEYLDDDELKALDEDALDSMQDEGEVVVYLDRDGDVVFVDGDLGEEETTSFYAYLIKDSSGYDVRDGYSWTLDVVNEKGAQVDYDLDADSNSDAPDVYDGDLTAWGNEADAGAIVKITLDEDGDVDKVEFVALDVSGTVDPDTGDPYFETDDSYVDGYKLDSDAVVFITEDYDDTKDYDDDDNAIEVKTFGELDFDEIDDAVIYADDDDIVVVLVVDATDKEDDTTEYAGIVTDVKEFSGEDTCRLILLVDGKEGTYYTADNSTVKDAVYALDNGAVIEFTFDNNAEEIVSDPVPVEVTAAAADMVDGDIVTVSVRDKEIVVGGVTYDLSDAVLYDATDTDDIDEISVRDLDVDDTVTLYLFDDGSRFVKYLLLTTEAE